MSGIGFGHRGMMVPSEGGGGGCDSTTLSINGAPQTFLGLTGCPLALDVNLHDQLGRDITLAYAGANLYTYDVNWGANVLATQTTFVNPHFVTGHIYRLTGTTFGYKIGANYFDVNGVATTEALAFPNDLVIDWYQAKNNVIGATNRVISVPCAGGNLAAQLGNLATLNSTGFAGYNDWTLIPAKFRMGLIDIVLGTPVMNFDPFNNADVTAPLGSVYCKEENAALSTQQWFADATGTVGVGNKTTSRGCHIYREFTNAQLGI